jgi:hypothetical protein
MSFEKLPAINTGSIACLTCGRGAHTHADLDREIAVGFGDAGYSRDGEVLWSEADFDSDNAESFPTVADVEKMAKEDPDRDWRIYFHAPLYDVEYQRQGEGLWLLVKKGMGFA